MTEQPGEMVDSTFYWPAKPVAGQVAPYTATSCKVGPEAPAMSNDEPDDACVERAHWHFDFPAELVADIVRTLRD